MTAPGLAKGGSRLTVMLALGLMGMIVMMVLPMPSYILDIGLAMSFGLAILIFLVTLFAERPVDFSSFSTMLLASLLLRLSLNVSSTKLIIGEGHSGPRAAGDVIYGFSSFVMGGSILMGLVVFLVLLIVNFVVITKGAARMAEVGARFALDGMPGKQLAIDSDMSAGAITHAEAKERRATEQAETAFFGSLDGASKFVKGDAIAGLLITLLNLVVGFLVGVFSHGMTASDAFETYAILTVGDGLVNQIPAVIISVASALLLARGGATGPADTAITEQITRHPPAIAAVGALMMVFALFPGLPFLPFSMIGGAILAAAFVLERRRRSPERGPAGADDTEASRPVEKRLGDLLDLDDIHVEFAPDLVGMVLDPDTGLDARIERMRNHVATTYGVVMPEIRLTDNPELPQNTYSIRIQGVPQATDLLYPDLILALDGAGDVPLPEGRTVLEPVYGAPGRWISPQAREQAVLGGLTIVTPVEVLATHLLEIVKRNFSRLLTLKALRRLMREMTTMSDPDRAEANRRLIDELVPDKVPTELLLSVLRLLLDERVSIRNLPVILEAVSEARGMYSSPESICEYVRQRLGFQLVGGLRRADGTVPLLQLAPAWEDIFARHEAEGAGRGRDVALPPAVFAALTRALSDAQSRSAAEGTFPALVTSAHRRRFLASIAIANGLSMPVLSFEELGIDSRPAIVGEVAAP